MACCAFAVWIVRLTWRGVRALGHDATGLLGRRAAQLEPAPSSAPTVARGQLADR